MSMYNRKGLTHSKKGITSSLGSTKPRYSIEAATFPSSKRRFSENVSIGLASSMLNIPEKSTSYYKRDLKQFNDRYINLENYQDILEVRRTPTIFVSISKPSPAIDKLIAKRKTGHEDAVRNMKHELVSCYTICENEFRNRSISVKIQINEIRKLIKEVEDKLRSMNLLDSNSMDIEIAWKKMSTLIENEKQIIHRFYNRLLIIEEKRRDNVKLILQKYYKIFHNISFLLPYEIQIYMENEILNYNTAVLQNHRIYADLHLQMLLLADVVKLKLKNLIEELKINFQAIFMGNN